MPFGWCLELFASKQRRRCATCGILVAPGCSGRATVWQPARACLCMGFVLTRQNVLSVVCWCWCAGTLLLSLLASSRGWVPRCTSCTGPTNHSEGAHRNSNIKAASAGCRTYLRRVDGQQWLCSGISSKCALHPQQEPAPVYVPHVPLLDDLPECLHAACALPPLATRLPVCVCRFDEECRGQVAENLGKRGITCHAGELPTK